MSVGHLWMLPASIAENGVFAARASTGQRGVDAAFDGYTEPRTTGYSLPCYSMRVTRRTLFPQPASKEGSDRDQPFVIEHACRRHFVARSVRHRARWFRNRACQRLTCVFVSRVILG